MASLSGESLADTSGLATSGPDVSFEKPNLRDRATSFALGPFSSPAIDKPVKIYKICSRFNSSQASSRFFRRR